MTSSSSLRRSRTDQAIRKAQREWARNESKDILRTLDRLMTKLRSKRKKAEK